MNISAMKVPASLMKVSTMKVPAVKIPAMKVVGRFLKVSAVKGSGNFRTVAVNLLKVSASLMGSNLDKTEQ